MHSMYIHFAEGECPRELERTAELLLEQAKEMRRAAEPQENGAVIRWRGARQWAMRVDGLWSEAPFVRAVSWSVLCDRHPSLKDGDFEVAESWTRRTWGKSAKTDA